MNAIIGKLKDKPSLVTLLIILLIAVQIILIGSVRPRLT